ncbi:acyl carrier protein [Streptomyces sp. NPDC096040]|uniref:acyl carrier protein n=1 Tax=Streptomyces sp. NPDC096040 TaxID=3155541 RepID=UPI00331E4BDE
MTAVGTETEVRPAAPGEAEASVRAEALDCLQANLAVLADRHHGPGTHLRLGARLHFRPTAADATALPTVEPTPDAQLAAAEEALGLTVTERRHAVPGREAAGTTTSLYVVADAYHLPWVPYYGHKHVEHSFLVEAAGDDVTVVDAYHNDTQWGRARPLRHRLTRDRLAQVLADIPGGVDTVRLVPRALGPAPEAVYVRPDEAVITEYLRAYAEHGDRVAALERFTLETWLLARSRHLHAAYAAAQGPAGTLSPRVREHLERWDGVVEHAYLAYRRVARGRAEPLGVLARAGEALRADGEVFGAGPAGAGPDPSPRAVVRATVASVLNVAEHLLDEGELNRFPEFGSLRMVEIVERLEQLFGVEFAPEDLVPERLCRIDDLCSLVSSSPPAATGR